jgi:hypothetical protein
VTTFRIEAVNPLEWEGPIKALFHEAGRHEYAAFFDRAYARAAAQGARSWVGFDETGALVMHMAVFPRRFAVDGREVTGGLGVNLLVAEAHRRVGPALLLLRTLIEDLVREGRVDFLFADPNAQGAAISRLAGLRPVGTLERFFLPLADRTVLRDLAFRVHLHFRRLAGPRLSRMAVTRAPAAEVDPSSFEYPPGQSRAMRPLRAPTLYPERLGGFPADDDTWYLFAQGPGTLPAAAVLVREVGDRAHLSACWRLPNLPFASLVHPVATALRARGLRGLNLWTVRETTLGREALSAGFFPRGDRTMLLARALTPLGEDVLAATPDWEVTDLDFDRGA